MKGCQSYFAHLFLFARPFGQTPSPGLPSLSSSSSAGLGRRTWSPPPRRPPQLAQLAARPRVSARPKCPTLGKSNVAVAMSARPPRRLTPSATSPCGRSPMRGWCAGGWAGRKTAGAGGCSVPRRTWLCGAAISSLSTRELHGN